MNRHLRRALAKAVVLAALAGFTALTYAVVVVGLGTLFDVPRLILVVAATVLVGAGFTPVKRAVRRLTRQTDPYALMRRLATAGAGTADEAIPELVRVVKLATGATEVVLWIGNGPPPPADHLVPVHHRGEALGGFALVGVVPGARERELLADLAAHAGLVLRNARLAAQLQARLAELSLAADALTRSRAGIAAAAEEERRRLGRDLDQLAIPHLTAIGAVLRPEVKVDELRPHIDAALDSVRNISHGLRP